MEAKHLNHLVALLQPVAFTTSAADFQDPGISASKFPGVVDNLGNNIGGLIGDDDDPGVLMLIEGSVFMKDKDTGNVPNDGEGNDISMSISKRELDSGGVDYIDGMNTIMVSQDVPDTGFTVHFDVATSSVTMSTDGGSNYGPAVDLSALSANDYFRMENDDGSVYLYCRRSATALPVADTDQASGASDSSTYNGMFVKYVDDEFLPLHYSAPGAAGTELYLYVPYANDVGQTKPSAQLKRFMLTAFDITPVPDPPADPPDYQTDWRHEEFLTVTAQNTVSNLTYTPSDGLRLYVNKERQMEGAGKDYTVSGKAITIDPRGFNVEVGDEVFVDYQTTEK